jgi:hypothetical protein
MGWWEDWGETALNVMTGGIYEAAKEGSHAAADALRQAADEQAAMQAMQAMQDQLQASHPGVNRAPAPRIPTFPGVTPGVGGRIPTFPGMPVPSTVAGSDGRSDCCCDRFQLEDGLLLDKTTGRVWEYDKSGKAFVFLPMKPAAEHEQIADIMLEKNLSAITSRYTEEVLSTLPPRARAAQLTVFEKSYIEPLRASMRSRKPKKNP